MNNIDTPLKKQIGGDHYKMMKMQPVELYATLEHKNFTLNYFQSNIVKYVSRYEHKNGKQDLQKICHIADLAINLQLNNILPTLDENIKTCLYKYISVNHIQETEAHIIIAAAHSNYRQVIELCSKLIEVKYP